MKNQESYDKIKQIINQDFKGSEDEKKKAYKEIKKILLKLDSDILEIRDLKDKTFVIPDYQRAYRWGTDEITKLIKDIYLKVNQSYFLQPIIYRKDINDKDIIIDGQQRLTSIYIILKVLEKYNSNQNTLVNYTIEYETRNESTEFLKNLDSNNANINIDIFHMNMARETVQNIIESENIDIERLEHSILKTKFIYHQIDENDENKIFQRINTGKIALTNGELVKGLLLNKKNGAQRNEWAVIWDEMEKSLHNEDFFCMYNNDLLKYQDTRIDFVLEVVANKIIDKNQIQINKKNIYWIFETLEEYSQQNDINELWEIIRECYRILKKWYDNIEIYHLIGYILFNNIKKHNIIFLMDEYQRSINKKDFIKKLYNIIKEQNKSISIKTANIPERIKSKYPNELMKSKTISIIDKETLKIVCENLYYGENNKGIKKVLLLFNILTFLQKSEDAKTKNIALNRFSFGYFKKEAWDIEHIHAKGEEDNKNENLKILEQIINENDRKKLEEIKERVEKSIVEDMNIDSKIFNIFYDEVLLNNEEEMTDDDTINSLRNLTLLDSKTNREYKDNVFIIKRHIILEKDRNRKFIPICTRNVFLKYYSKNIRQIACWSEEDGNDYLQEIINTISCSPIYNKEKDKSE